MRTKVALTVAAALAATSLTATAVAATAAKPLTGTWSGKTSQDLSLTEKEWSVRITVTALKGRLAGIYTTIRMECPDPAVQDIRIVKSFGGRGPLLTKGGGFDVRINGVSIEGALGSAGSTGHFDIARGGCSGNGTWKARRVL